MNKITIDKIIEIVNNNIANDVDTTNINPQKHLSGSQLDEDLTKLGMDSIVFIHMIVALEEEFECEIPDSKLSRNEMNTIRKITDVLQDLYYASII